MPRAINRPRVTIPLMDTNSKDQVVLITGASGGIGGATARAFGDANANLVLHYHRNAEAVRALQDELSVACMQVQADLRDAAQTQTMFDRAIEHFGRIDSVIVNAGIWMSNDVPLVDMSTEQWRDTIDCDLTSAFLTCRTFLQHLKDQPRDAASIVLVGSTAAIFGEAGHGDYAAAKAGLVYGLLPTLKNEIVRLAPRGRVNAVCPGWTATPMAAHTTRDESARLRAFATMPLRKFATPEDVARSIVFLASEALAGHITGAMLPVSGGMEGRLLWSHRP